MENIVLAVHLLTALAIIGLILLQQGKGAEMGASFGAGASQTLFGSVGSGNFFSRLTAIFATVFFVTSFTLAVMSKQKTEVSDVPLPALEIGAPAEVSEIPEVEDIESEIPSVDSSVEDAEIPEVTDEELPEVPVE